MAFKASSKFKVVTVHLDDGTSYKTDVNAGSTDAEIEKYFVGAMLNFGCVEDNVKQCVKVEIESPKEGSA